MNIPAVLVENILGDDRQPAGAIQFDGDFYGLIYVCPCGCGELRSVPICRGATTRANHWWWDGDTERPTLEPSILHLDKCRWHGWLRNGEWVSC